MVTRTLFNIAFRHALRFLYKKELIKRKRTTISTKSYMYTLEILCSILFKGKDDSSVLCRPLMDRNFVAIVKYNVVNWNFVGVYLIDVPLHF